MSLDTDETPQSNGLKTVLDIVVAPKEAFERIRISPTWGWAFAIAALLLVGGYVLQRPAQLHAAVGTVEHMFATNSLFSNMTPEQKQRAIERASHPAAIQTAIGIAGVILSLLLAALLNTVVLLLGSLAGKGTGDFRRLWAGSMNVAVPTFGLSYVVLGIICVVLGADHFTTTGDILRAIPGLATLVPSAGGMLGGFLIGINLFTLWGFALNVAMMRVVAGVQNAAVWIFPLIVLLGGALLQGAMASFYGI